MAHQQQIEFCVSVKNRHPEMFENKVVYDFGSLDINGNNRYLFTDCDYTGIDLVKGNNVDIVKKAHLYKPKKKADLCISCEMLEHDKHWEKSIKNMLSLLKSGGGLLITCDGEYMCKETGEIRGRAEHGTKRTETKSSPHTTDYYKNISVEKFEKAIGVKNFSSYSSAIHKGGKVGITIDFYFFGIKK